MSATKSAMTALERRFRGRTSGPKATFRQDQTVLPGGLTRSTLHVEPYPLALDSGSAATVVDEDGNAYVDLVNNYTALVHGDAHSATVAALNERLAARRWVSPHAAQVRLAGSPSYSEHASISEVAELASTRWPLA